MLWEWRHEIIVITLEKHIVAPHSILYDTERFIEQENIILSVSIQVSVCILAYSEGWEGF